MRLIYSQSILVLTFILLSSSMVLAKKDFTKEVNRTFKTTATGTVDISNKYGKVNIKTWDKNTVKIQAKIVVNAKDATKAEEYFDKIKINFSNAEGIVKAHTEKEETKSSWSWWGSSSSWKYKVHYDVYMPKQNSLKLANKYGDIYVAEMKGNANIALKYGNGKLTKIGGALNLSLGYGKLTVAEIQNANIIIKYSKLTLRQSKNVTIQSKYSNISIDKASDIKSISKYDDYFIGTVNDVKTQGKYDDYNIKSANSIDANGKYSTFVIEHLDEDGDFDTRYGDVIIHNLSKAFDKLKLIGEYTDYVIDAEDNASFQIDAASEYTTVKMPSNMNKKVDKKHNNSREVQGQVGDGNSKSYIKVRTKYGSIKIKLN